MNQVIENPYAELPRRHYWRTAVADRSGKTYQELWGCKWSLAQDVRFATYGSCFAQHISRALIAKKLNWVNEEPGPKVAPDELNRAFNYDIYSARTGNIYTAAQLLTWASLAAGTKSIEAIEIAEGKDGRFYDMLRPTIEPNGFASIEEARASLQTAINAFRRSVAKTSVFVFTMGLTEGWENRETGMIYAMCPGTAAGTYNEDIHKFVNYDFGQIHADMERAIGILRTINPDLNILLTVSPVPLVATMSERHVLVATTYSKSVLRAVAGALETQHEYVDYFPSYEIITAPSSFGRFYMENLRSVKPEGVEFVMRHFFEGLNLSRLPKNTGADAPNEESEDATYKRLKALQEAEDLACDETILDSKIGK